MNRESVKRYGVRLQSAHQLLIPNGRVITTTLLRSGDRAVRLAAECIFWGISPEIAFLGFGLSYYILPSRSTQTPNVVVVGATRSRCVKLMLAIDIGMLI